MDGDVSQGASRGPSPTYEERYATRLTPPTWYPALSIRLDENWFRSDFDFS